MMLETLLSICGMMLETLLSMCGKMLEGISPKYFRFISLKVRLKSQKEGINNSVRINYFLNPINQPLIVTYCEGKCHSQGNSWEQRSSLKNQGSNLEAVYGISRF